MGESRPIQKIPSERLGENRQQGAIIGICIAILISSFIVFVRIYARAMVIRQFGWDDLVIVFAMIFSWALVPPLVMVVLSGGGRHLIAVVNDDPAALDKLTLWMGISSTIYIINLVVCRISGILFYARLNSMPRFVLYLRLTCLFVVAAFLVQVVVTIIRCLPIADIWKKKENSERCFGAATISYNSALTLSADLLVLILPTNIILSLKATLSRKILLGIILSFGMLTSAGRIVAVFRTIDHPDDITWYLPDVVIWTAAEISTAIIALSLPALKGLCGFMLKPRVLEIDQTDSHQYDIPLGRAGDITRQEIPIVSHSYRKEGSSRGGRSTSQEQLWS
ncbi:uncharacterized protein KD926_006395 [Aspergillus affinis]|uniref:uncharacterized protein n=1 Tax=Aspergillus affinis TaxID=1070780 RepID=UPI0022FDBC00|nr:uncharacterized protein KD926_006395 [Aspergillus affinis]KAI9041850.1 hypothetical protein KD926_006395 [Aspergillus affinis]